MNESRLEKRLRGIFADVFDVSKKEINDESLTLTSDKLKGIQDGMKLAKETKELKKKEAKERKDKKAKDKKIVKVKKV